MSLFLQCAQRRYTRARQAWLSGTLGLLSLTQVLLLSTAGLAGSADSGPSSTEQLDKEARLLHHKLPLSGWKRWDRRSQTWQVEPPPTEPLLVINLWSAHCQPCLQEFPQLARMAAAWKSQREVRFLFLADPPRDTEAHEVVAFWTSHAAELPDADPLRSTSEELRATLGTGLQPITLLLDHDRVVRQAFVGSLGQRGLGNAIERLIKVLPTTRKASSRHR